MRELIPAAFASQSKAAGISSDLSAFGGTI